MNQNKLLAKISAFSMINSSLEIGKCKIVLVGLLILLAATTLAFKVDATYSYVDEYVEIRINLRNPTNSKSTEDWSFELPSLLRASDIISLNGVNLKVDPIKGVTVYGTETLEPNSNSVKKLKVRNVWVAEKRIKEIEKSTNELLNLIDSIPKDSPYYSKALELKEIAKQNLAKIKADLKTDSADKLIKNWAKSEAVLNDLEAAKHELELLLQGKLEKNKGLSSSMVVFVFGTISIMIALGLMWYAKKKQKVEYVGSPMVRRLPVSEPITLPREPRIEIPRAYPKSEYLRYPIERRLEKYPEYQYSRVYPIRQVHREMRYPFYRREYREYYPKRYEEYYPKKYRPEYDHRLGRALVREFMRELKEELRKELIERRGNELARAIRRELIRELKEEFRKELSYWSL